MSFARIADHQAAEEPSAYDALIIQRADGEKVHLIISDTTPEGVTTYDDAPVGSICIDIVGAAIYFKLDATTWGELTVTSE